jgi:uncharacterized cupredoxin-like copper-binding protein
MKKLSLILAFGLLPPAALAHPDHGDRFPGAREVPVQPAPVDKPHGRAGDSAKISRAVSLDMSDSARCSPEAFHVKRGETVKFVARNSGRQPQDFAMGTAPGLKEHAEMMRKFPQMQGSAPDRVRVKAGETAELVWQFTQPGEFNVSCAPSGQYAAGSLGKVIVSP